MLNDKEKLIELLKKNLFDDYDFEDIAEELIANGVTVRAKGKWVRQDDTYTRFMCSNCGTKNHAFRYDYCSHCGADMKGAEHEQTID